MRAFRYVYLLAGLFLVIAGGYEGWITSMAWLEANASKQWPSVPGRILSSKTVFIVGNHGSEAPDIRYAYNVGSRPFEGSRLGVVTYSANTSYAADAVAEFQQGNEVPVFYDPADPARSVLRRGSNGIAMALPAISAVFLLFGLALFSSGLRMIRSPR